MGMSYNAQKMPQKFIGSLFTEYFDLDDPCTYHKNKGGHDQGDLEDIVSAYEFLRGIAYTHKEKDPKTGTPTIKRREIVSTNAVAPKNPKHLF